MRWRSPSRAFPSLTKAEPALVDDAIDFVLQSLETSHTARYPTGSVEYYELLDVFRFAARDAVRRLYPPEGNITYDGIGMATRSIDGTIFVTDVYDGGPADKAGVLAGDEILWVDGKPFTGTEAVQWPHRRLVGSHRSAASASADPITLTVPVERLRAVGVAGRGDGRQRRGRSSATATGSAISASGPIPSAT